MYEQFQNIMKLGPISQVHLLPLILNIAIQSMVIPYF